MAAKTFNLSANGTAASQQLDGPTLALFVSGNPGGGNLQIEVSPNNTNFAPAFTNRPGESLSPNCVRQFFIPAGWYVRPVLNGATGTPSLVVVVE